MNARARQIYILVIVILFLGLAPVTVLVALGYRYDTLHGRLQKTGAIVLVTLPHNANIEIDGITIKHRTPTVVRSLLPGNHVVRIVHPQAIPWEKRVTVVAGRSTLYDSILLAPAEDRWREERTIAGNSVLAGESSDSIAWISSTHQVMVGSTVSNNNDRPITASCETPTTWSPYNRFLLCGFHDGWTIIDRQDDWNSWTIPLPTGTYTFRWNQTKESFVYAFNSDSLYEIDLYAHSTKQLAFSVTDLLARDSILYTLEQSGLDPSQQTVVERPLPTFERNTTRSVPANSLAFSTPLTNPLTIIGQHEVELISGNTTVSESFAESIKGTAWSAPLTSMLVWTDHEVWIIPPNNKEKTLIGRFDQAISKALWTGSWPAILIQQGDTLSFHDIDPRSQPYGPKLQETSTPLSSVFLHNGRLFTITQDTGTATIRSVQLF